MTMNSLRAPAVMTDVQSRIARYERSFSNFRASMADGHGKFQPAEIMLTFEQQTVTVLEAAHWTANLRELAAALEWVEMDGRKAFTAVGDAAAKTRQTCDWLAVRLPSSTNEISNLSENIRRKVAFEFLEYLQLLLHRFAYEEKEA
jgi:DNA-binding NtrC family response regulator